jgi:DNA mismatch repair protein MutS2
MNNNYLEKLEYNKILEILSSYAKTYIGKKLVLELTPSFDAIEVANLQLQTSEALSLLYKYGNPPIGDFNDVSIHFKKLESNNILSSKEILDLAQILKISKELSLFFDEVTKNIDNEFNSIKSFFYNLYLNIDLEKEIFMKIIDENTIDDRASDTLYNIRKSRKSLEQNVKDKLNHFIHSSTYSKYLMEPIITIRDNRFVIPVKDEYRSQVSGLVHDISSSGSTVFIEPTSIFDINNEINALKIKENIEIEKILTDLTTKLSAYISELENNVRLIGMIDFIFAKANYARTINGIFQA